MANEFIARKGLIALNNSSITGSLGVSGSLTIESSGSTLFEVIGSEGQLFSITDSLSGSLFAVSDVSGLPILEVFSDDKIVGGTFNSNTFVVTGSQIGIGHDSPSTLLHISGSAPLRIEGLAAGSETLFLTVDSSGNVKTNTSGADGSSGSSGTSGTSGANGSSGSSGTSGANGSSGSSGTSGTSGANGSSGSSGTSGANGSSGSSGTSGANGSSGSSGTSGTSGANGSSGSSGTSGANGSSGSSGTSGTSGANGSSGSSGTSGANGSSGSSGTSGTSGANGSSGSSGTSGANGSSGSSGTSGANGSSGSSGTSGANGSSGSSGTSGANGSSGSSGTSGANGANGSSGSSGTSGANGSSGTSGANGANGSSGSSGTSGVNGANGSSGSSGTSGVNGANGSSGSSGTSGANGANGSSGSSGTSGANGANGSSGSSGTSGANGSSGSSGTSGLSGDSYATTSSTSITIGTGTKVFTVSSGLSYTTAQSVVIAYDGSNYMEGSVTSYVGTTLTVDVTSTAGSGTYASWDINLAGAPGPAGSSGSSGTSGANGSSGSSGTSGANGSSGSSGTSGANGSSGSSGTSGTSFVGSITGTTSNGILTYVNATNNLAVEPNFRFDSSTNILTLAGQVNFINQAGTYLTSKNEGTPGEWWVYLGDSGSATGWLSVSETFGITGSIQGETFMFGDTNGFEISTDLTTTGIIYARDGIRSVASGTGTAGYSNQFWSLSGEAATFVILDSGGEETFRVTGSFGSRNYKIEFGDLGNSEDGNKFVLEDEFNRVYATNTSQDLKFGINTNNPEYALDVVGSARFSNREYTTYTPGSAGASVGDIIRIGTGTTVAGKTYHFDGTGWNQTNANPASSAATSGSLVAIALGTSPITNGMLIRGIAYPATISGMSGGETVYFDSTDGTLTITPPSTSNYIVRIAGHALSSTTIYFNPSPDWLIVA